MYRFVLAVACMIALIAPAHAYLDPGTGSFLLQMLVAGFLAAGATAKMYWFRVKSLFNSIVPPKKEDSR
jgi:hypothetical protein